MRFSLALLWLLISCSSLVRSEDPESGSVTKTGLDTYMDQPLLGGCEDARERLWIEPNGDLHWVVEHRSGFWERVTGTWTREVWGEARGQRGLALTGSLEGVFLPSGS
jgi:hypothetical protein